MPNVRRRELILRDSCVDSQRARRDSRGWVESGSWEGDEEEEEERTGPTP